MSRNAENGLLIFVCNIYEIFVMQKCYVIFILQLELSITNILKIFIECATSLFPNNHYSRFTPIYDTTKEFYSLLLPVHQ